MVSLKGQDDKERTVYILMQTTGYSMKQIGDLLQIAIDAALLAGKEIIEVYETGDFSVEMKSDDSPLTKADQLSHQVIVEQLARYELPLLSEEGSTIPYDERKAWDYYWLIDPLDGTKEFIRRNGTFTVNIALMKGTVPVAGVVYAPCLDTLYYGGQGFGGYKIVNGSRTALPHGDNISFDELLIKDNVVIVASRLHSNSETEEFIKRFKHYTLQSIGSSLKFMLLADDKADIYPRLAPTMEWDTAAAHAVLNAVNRKIYQLDLVHELEYNKQDLLNPSFIAF